ncbi:MULTISPECIES: nuclear transport factor 2 family protein [Pseudomonas]|uniref:Benzoate 1,2-dioxygenase small subunit n=1 Tax=Pseudomonas monteilii TaxID=76759 RepID=A0AAE6V321_9PSED|nr:MULTISPECIES: nuclear transport factor 2 family protein [Pseudomonas]MDH4549894.1 nuclear transport factor 2 family protein [Pseudomonas sp. BN607]MDH4846092.1 nuclear transport factor 2 family protein [Pseudomonas sp. BN605]MDH4858764.1 nuclear transport factor 2 family protein [Pseudomonas sp. BN505]NWL08043.1 nuclear transport factor 2 family protein [Pseudomonas hunanensis]QHB28806.1 benzoate 1,2-dioxygenase small subunit [Pseudomonas monteilii]
MDLQAEKQEQIQKLIDSEAIRRLLYEYAFHLDMNHTQQLADLFVEDCTVIYGPDFGAEGKEAYCKTLEGVGTYFVATSHHVSNTVIDFVSPTEAKLCSVLYAWHRYTRERPDGYLFGQYHDVVVKVDGQWRFKRRELRTTGVQDFHVKSTLPIGRA